jgi:hypothetical protein
VKQNALEARHPDDRDAAGSTFGAGLFVFAVGDTAAVWIKGEFQALPQQKRHPGGEASRSGSATITTEAGGVEAWAQTGTPLKGLRVASRNSAYAWVLISP